MFPTSLCFFYLKGTRHAGQKVAVVCALKMELEVCNNKGTCFHNSMLFCVCFGVAQRNSPLKVQYESSNISRSCSTQISTGMCDKADFWWSYPLAFRTEPSWDSLPAWECHSWIPCRGPRDNRCQYWTSDPSWWGLGCNPVPKRCLQYIEVGKREPAASSQSRRTSVEAILDREGILFTFQIDRVKQLSHVPSHDMTADRDDMQYIIYTRARNAHRRSSAPPAHCMAACARLDASYIAQNRAANSCYKVRQLLSCSKFKCQLHTIKSMMHI